jgi:hypothetical protein
MNPINKHLLQALAEVYHQLNLLRDKAPEAVSDKKLILTRQIAGIRLALGKNITEAELKKWIN